MFKKISRGRGFGSNPIQANSSNYDVRQVHPLQEPFHQVISNITDDANNTYDDSIQLDDKCTPEQLFRIGVNCCRSKYYERGIKFLVKAADKDPFVYSTHYNLGKAYNETQAYDKAIDSLLRCLELKPDHVEARIVLAACFGEKHEFSRQQALLEEVLTIQPMHFGAQYNLALSISRQGKYNEALGLFESLFSQNLSFIDAGINAADCCQRLGLYLRQKELLELVLAAHPESIAAQQHLALCLLRHGDWLNGWILYETRFKHDSNNPVLIVPYTNPPIPRWESAQLKFNARYCVVAEQGLGDFFQFIRFYPVLRSRVQTASLCCCQDLHGLLRMSNIENRPHSSRSIDWENYDYWIPLMSLPLLVCGGNEPFLDGKSYIHPPKQLTANRQDKTVSSSNQMLTIGVNWQGSSSHEGGRIGTGRSFPLEALGSIATIDNIRFLSLQYGQGLEQLESCSFKDRFLPFGTGHNDTLESTVKLIESVDIVLTNDSAPAHLAGALGKETWLLLKKHADWRWGDEGNKTHWYQSLTLYRQLEDGNWDSVFDQVRVDLLTRLHDK